MKTRKFQKVLSEVGLDKVVQINKADQLVILGYRTNIPVKAIKKVNLNVCTTGEFFPYVELVISDSTKILLVYEKSLKWKLRVSCDGEESPILSYAEALFEEGAKWDVTHQCVSKKGKLLWCYSDLDAVKIPGYIKEVGLESLPVRCSLLDMNNVKKVRPCCFLGIPKVKVIWFSGGCLESIQHAAFMGCLELEMLILPSKNIRIEDGAFSLTSLTPDGIVINGRPIEVPEEKFG